MLLLPSSTVSSHSRLRYGRRSRDFAPESYLLRSRRPFPAWAWWAALVQHLEIGLADRLALLLLAGHVLAQRVAADRPRPK